MKLVTSELMRQIDRTTIDDHGIAGPELMENAGRGIAEFMLCTITPSDRVAVFCGKGNNGGDGFVIARYLCQAEHEVTVYYPATPDDLSPDARLNFDRAIGQGISIVAIADASSLPDRIEGRGMDRLLRIAVHPGRYDPPGTADGLKRQSPGNSRRSIR